MIEQKAEIEEPKTSEKTPANDSTAATATTQHALEDSDEEVDTQLSTYNPLTSGSRLRSKENEDEARVVKPARKLTMLNIPKVSELVGAKSGLNSSEEKSKMIKFYVTKLPNILGIQSQCFDKQRYNCAEEEKAYKGYTHNIIRWRYKKDASGELVRDAQGNLVRESNARFIKYSDGSMHLQVGNERFEIDSHPADHSYVYLSQRARLAGGQDVTVLESQGMPIAAKLMTRPSSLQSAAHKSLTLALRQKTMKQARMKEYSTHQDPEKMKQEKIKMKNDLYKDANRRRSGTTRRRVGMNRSYLDDEDDAYESTNVGYMKKSIKGGYDSYADDSESDGGAAWEKERMLKSNKGGAKRGRQESSSEDDNNIFGSDSDDDDEDEVFARSRKRQVKSSQAIDSDSD